MPTPSDEKKKVLEHKSESKRWCCLGKPQIPNQVQSCQIRNGSSLELHLELLLVTRLPRHGVIHPSIISERVSVGLDVK